jgi:hypothetical protein
VELCTTTGLGRPQLETVGPRVVTARGNEHRSWPAAATAIAVNHHSRGDAQSVGLGQRAVRTAHGWIRLVRLAHPDHGDH